MKPLAAQLCAILVLSVTCLGQAQALREAQPDPLGGTGGGPIAGQVHVRVVQAGTILPIAGAFVMVGTMPGAFYPGNYGFTSAAGEITFTSPSLQGPLMITAGAEGFRFFTLVSVDANDSVIPLSPIAPIGPLYNIGDAVSGIDVNNGSFHVGDGNLDMAIVVPSMRMSDLLGFDAGRFFGPPETIDVVGQPVEVPSNCFIPQQWELFIEIIKDHYGLRLPAGEATLTAISGRIPTDAILSGAPMEELLPYVQWREIDVLNLMVTGDMATADLNVDPDLQTTVTLNLENVPDGGTAYCLSIGDLDDQTGLGRLVPLGLNSLACPAGSGPCAGTVSLTTTPAAGEFSGMGYFPAATVSMSSSDDLLVLLSRGPHPQSYTESMGSFFKQLDLACTDGDFSWNDVANLANGSPSVHLQQALLRTAAGDSVLWEFMLPGDDHAFIPPTLPASAPPSPLAGSTYGWEQRSIGLGYDLPTFDFNSFSFSAISAHATHVAADQMEIVLSYPAAGALDANERRRLSLGILGPTPGPAGTTLQCVLEDAAPADLSILAVDGRVIATLVHGPMPAGSHQIRWPGRDSTGRPLPSGVYFARLRSGGETACTRVLLLR
jgi:hypothetical protein